MNMTHFSLSELPETQQESGSTLSSQTDIKCQSSEVLFNTLQEASCPSLPWCFKESSNKYGYLASLPSRENESEREEGTKGRYTSNTQEVAAVIKGAGGV